MILLVFPLTVFMEIVEEKSRYALQEHLHLITAPLQVIWGKHDQVVPLINLRSLHTELQKRHHYLVCLCLVSVQVVDVSGAMVIKEVLPKSRVDILENCGHSVVMERPRRTAKLILEFIILQQDARGGTKKSC